MGMSAKLVSVSFPEELLDRLDEVRGLVPRSALIQDLVRRFLEQEEVRDG